MKTTRNIKMRQLLLGYVQGKERKIATKMTKTVVSTSDLTFRRGASTFATALHPTTP